MTQDRALEILKLGHSVFLTGEAGSGKSYTIGKFIEWMEEQEREYAVTASTGIAASHIDGQTIHSWAAIGIDRNLTEAQIDKAAGRAWERAHKVKTLILDEVSMVDAVLLEDLNKILQKVHRNTRIFGGVQMVFVGDFFQLPPIGKREDAEPPRFAFESSAWERAGLVICYLTEQHRQATGDGIMEVLTAMRHGNLTDTERDLVRTCTKNKPSDTRLYTHNMDVDALNNQELAKIKGKEKKFMMKEEGSEYMIASLKRQCLSPETLKLKVGARVMFTRNNVKLGYVNGTIGKVARFEEGWPVIELLDGSEVSPETAEWNIKQWKDGYDEPQVVASVKQIPLRLAWAITVHKSQGMSLDSASIDLSKTFEFGQGYVALSRVRTLAGIHLLGINEKSFEMHPRVVEMDSKFRTQGE